MFCELFLFLSLHSYCYYTTEYNYANKFNLSLNRLTVCTSAYIKSLSPRQGYDKAALCVLYIPGINTGVFQHF